MLKIRNKKTFLFLILNFIILFLLFLKAENDTKTIITKHIHLKYDNIKPSLKNYKIGFISDIHLGPSTHKGFIEKIVRKLNKENLDLLIIGGDNIWFEETRYLMLKRTDEFNQKNSKDAIKAIYKKVASNISKIKTRDGIFFIMGNHDNWIYPNLLKREIKKFKNLKIFAQNIYNIRKKDGFISLYTFDDFWNESPNVEDNNLNLKENEFRIVLSHNPDAIFYLDKYFSLPYHLSLSGHTHGGQIKLPFIPIVTNTFFKKLSSGLQKEPFGYHYTSTGLGCTSIPFRFGVPPEITVFILQNNDN